MAQRPGDTVTVKGERYRVASREVASPQLGNAVHFVFVLERVSDGTRWRTSGRRVQYNSILTRERLHS